MSLGLGLDWIELIGVRWGLHACMVGWSRGAIFTYRWIKSVGIYRLGGGFFCNCNSSFEEVVRIF